MQLSGALLLYSIQVKCYSAPLPSSTTHHFTFVMNLWNTTVSNDGGSTWTPVGSPTEALGDDVTYVRALSDQSRVELHVYGFEHCYAYSGGHRRFLISRNALVLLSHARTHTRTHTHAHAHKLNTPQNRGKTPKGTFKQTAGKLSQSRTRPRILCSSPT